MIIMANAAASARTLAIYSAAREHDMDDKVVMAVVESEIAVVNTLANLVESCTALAEHLTRVAAQAQAAIEGDEQSCSINSLGEVQSRGSRIDMLCAVLDAQQTALRSVSRI